MSEEGRATALEMDVRLSADRQLVVIHDSTVDRTTNARGKVRQRTHAELARLDAAHWWVEGSVVDHDAPPEAYVHRGRAPADPSYVIPRAEDVLDEHEGVPITIEIKAWRAAGPLVDALAARCRSDVTLVSFNDLILWLVRRRLHRHYEYTLQLAPGLVYMLWFRLRLALRVSPVRTRFHRIQIPTKKLGIAFATPTFVAAAHRAGMAVDVWTIDEECEMQSLIAMGVDGIMTDRPSVLARAVAEFD